jgi:membrane protein required for colicin V production
MTIPFTPVDFVILAVLGLSGFFAAYRGFVNELLSIMGWGLAAVITAVLFGSIRGSVREMVEPDWFADIVGFVGLFLAVIIPISFVAYRVGEAARQSSIGPLDRSLGFVYGVLRGLVVASLAYMLFVWLSPNRPQWMNDARLIPIVQRSSDVLASLVNGKQPRGVSVSAPSPQQDAPRRQPAEPRPAPPAPAPDVPPPAPPVEARRAVPPPKPEPVRESPPPPASEVGGLAHLIQQPEAAAAAAKPGKAPSPQPAQAKKFRTQTMETEATKPARTAPREDTAQPARPAQKAEKSKAKPETAKPKAKAKQPKTEPQIARTKATTPKRPAKTQIASTERRPAASGSGDKTKGKGYGARDRQALDQLVRSTTREP